MKCPECGNIAKRPDGSMIVDSRLTHGDTVRWRRRKCPFCGDRYTTKETIEEKKEWIPEEVLSVKAS